MKKRGKMQKRIMAFIMSGMLLVSNTVVLAQELDDNQTELVLEETAADNTEEIQEESSESAEDVAEEETTSETTVDSEEEIEPEETTELTTEGSEEATEALTEEIETETETETETLTEEIMLMSLETSEIPYDESKIDVWDFGAEELDTDQYNNLLTVDVINGFYDSSIPAGSAEVTIASFSEEHGLSFSDGGFKDALRLRTANKSLTRYDTKNAYKDAEGNAYQGVLYSNKSANENVYLSIEAKAGDTITAMVTSNKKADSIIHFRGNGEDQTYTYEMTSSKLEKAVFYAPVDGTYKIYSETEKLVVARIYREHNDFAKVSGTVNAPEGLTDYQLVFENQELKTKTEVEVVNGTYQVDLLPGYTYDISLQNAVGYGITSDNSVEITGDKYFDITVGDLTTVTIAGNIEGLEDAVNDLALAFEATTESNFEPKVTVDRENSTYEAVLQQGVTYEISATNINDYEMTSATLIQALANEEAHNLTFVAKPVYQVTIVPEGATEDALAEAEFTFTNLNEEGYSYKFTGIQNIALRDGTYSITVNNAVGVTAGKTSNLVVAGMAVTKTIKFISDIEREWNFSNADFISGQYSTEGAGTYKGLQFSKAKSHGNEFLYASSGTIQVPVSGTCNVEIKVCYAYNFGFEEEPAINENTGSTAQKDIYVYKYVGDAGYVTINVLGTSYINSIATREVEEEVVYKDTITVGTHGDYTTINDALEAVRSMTREASERVTIEIEPGNYEEMLILDMDNVTLKNASSTPTAELLNQGVDIDSNTVRITSYYGHGYDYYSMTDGSRWDEETLAINKENGKASHTNEGAGTKKGSYWNATVIISGSGIEANDIIFENSFNQYISQKASEDVLVKHTAENPAKEGDTPRADLPVGSTKVQEKAYVERAAALAIIDKAQQIYFENCKFVGRQDTLYGGVGNTAAFKNCDIFGGTDYIFGGMTAVFYECDLVMNTSSHKNDVAYITAAQQRSNDQNGYFMYKCHIRSAVPGVETASTELSKPGYFGRPWQPDTSEVIFYETTIDAANDGTSLVAPIGWGKELGGTSDRCYEYGTVELAEGVDNTSARATWSHVITDPLTISLDFTDYLGDWEIFKESEIVTPPVVEEPSEEQPGANPNTGTSNGSNNDSSSDRDDDDDDSTSSSNTTTTAVTIVEEENVALAGDIVIPDVVAEMPGTTVAKGKTPSKTATDMTEQSGNMETTVEETLETTEAATEEMTTEEAITEETEPETETMPSTEAESEMKNEVNEAKEKGNTLAVVGAIAGLAVVAGGIFVFLRKRK